MKCCLYSAYTLCRLREVNTFSYCGSYPRLLWEQNTFTQIYSYKNCCDAVHLHYRICKSKMVLWLMFSLLLHLMNGTREQLGNATLLESSIQDSLMSAPKSASYHSLRQINQMLLENISKFWPLTRLTPGTKKQTFRLCGLLVIPMNMEVWNLPAHSHGFIQRILPMEV